MMKRSLRKSEIVLILILTALLLGLIYYQFVYKYFNDAKERYNTDDLALQIEQEQLTQKNIQDMQAEIEENKGNETGEVATYDNLKNEINALNDIFADADSFNFGFDQATANGTAVRRVINASFTAADYKTAKQIIQNLHDCKYRCLITDVSITSAGPQNVDETQTSDQQPNLNSDKINVSLTVTFFETLYDATTTDGLLIEDDGSTADGDRPLTDVLSEERDRYESMGTDEQ